MNNSNEQFNQSEETITHVIKNLQDSLSTTNSPAVTSVSDEALTQIQTLVATLTHAHTQVELELPNHFSVIHIGKPNDHVPPDIDVSGFPHSQVVSRIHADIIRTDDDFYIEDTGSANGTYINHTPLPKGNRHLLKSGDRIAFGKEDRVSFIFNLKM